MVLGSGRPIRVRRQDPFDGWTTGIVDNFAYPNGDLATVSASWTKIANTINVLNQRLDNTVGLAEYRMTLAVAVGAPFDNGITFNKPLVQGAPNSDDCLMYLEDFSATVASRIGHRVIRDGTGNSYLIQKISQDSVWTTVASFPAPTTEVVHRIGTQFIVGASGNDVTMRISIDAQIMWEQINAFTWVPGLRFVKLGESFNNPGGIDNITTWVHANFP